MIIDKTIKEKDEFTGFFDSFDDGGGGGNPRCYWDESVCSETVTHHITLAFFDQNHEVTATEAYTYCGRHYALELVKWVFDHSPKCPITLEQHLVKYGEI